MTRLLAIDPGTTETGWCIIDTADLRPFDFAKSANGDLLEQQVRNPRRYDAAVIEMVASYGMPVGREVFETVRWIGRYEQVIRDLGIPVALMFRQDVKLHLCRSTKANDATIAQALRDRFAYGQPNRGKGTKAAPGWFYGFRADVWASYALAVTYAETAL